MSKRERKVKNKTSLPTSMWKDVLLRSLIEVLTDEQFKVFKETVKVRSKKAMETYVEGCYD